MSGARSVAITRSIWTTPGKQLEQFADELGVLLGLSGEPGVIDEPPWWEKQDD